MESRKNRKTYSLDKARKIVKKERRKNRLMQLLWQIPAVFAVLAIIITVYNNHGDLSFNGIFEWVKDSAASVGYGGGYPVSDAGIRSIHQFNGAIAEITDTSYIFLNSTGKKISTHQHSYTDPQIATSSHKAILYDRGGKEFSVETLSETIYTGKTENDIISASVADDGTYAFLTEDDAYMTHLTVYSRDQSVLFEWKSAEYRICSVALQKRGNEVAVTGVKAEGGELKSCIIVFSYDKTEPKLKYELQGELLLSIQYMSNSRITVIGDIASYVVNTNDGTVTEIGYDGKSIINFSCSYGKGTAILLASAGGIKDCDIIVFDTKGQDVVTIDTGIESNNIFRKGKYIYCVSGDMLYEYNAKGELHEKFKIGESASKCIVIRSSAYVLGKSEIRKILL